MFCERCCLDRDVWKPNLVEDIVLLGVDGDRLIGGAIDGDPCVAPVQGQSQVEVNQTSSLVNVHDAPEDFDGIESTVTYLRSHEAVILRG